MILYELRCARDHRFEAWFKDAAAFDKQSARGAIACPFCGDTQIAKAPMAPRLVKGRERKEDAERRAGRAADHIFRAVEKLRCHVEENCDYVGDKFAEEARRIHYGEAEKRGIYGEASENETSELADEGIDVYPLRWWSRRDD